MSHNGHPVDSAPEHLTSSYKKLHVTLASSLFTADKLLPKLGAIFPKLRLQFLQQAIAVSQPALYIIWDLYFESSAISPAVNSQWSVVFQFPISESETCRPSFLCCSGERCKDRFWRSGSIGLARRFWHPPPHLEGTIFRLQNSTSAFVWFLLSVWSTYRMQLATKEAEVCVLVSCKRAEVCYWIVVWASSHL